MKEIEISREDLVGIIPSENILTHDPELGRYKLIDSVENAYGTIKYLYAHEKTGDIINITIKNLKSFYVGDTWMLRTIPKAEIYTLAKEFEIPELAEPPEEKRYPMYAYSGYDDFKKKAKPYGSGEVPQKLYDELFETSIVDKHVSKYFRSIKLKENILIAKE